jgi:hypothetical protein
VIAVSRLELSRAEWEAVAHELTGSHRAGVPPGLPQRIRALLAHAPPDWPEQRLVLELDASGAEVVRAVHAALAGLDPGAGQRAASLAEAERIIRDHQRRG